MQVTIALYAGMLSCHLALAANNFFPWIPSVINSKTEVQQSNLKYGSFNYLKDFVVEERYRISLHFYLGDYGFLLPADQINGTGAEFLAALKVVMEHIIEEARSDPYFNKPKLKQDTDNVVLENILRRKREKTKSRFQLSDDDRKSQSSNTSKQSIDSKNRSAATSKFTTNLVASLFTFLVILFVTFSKNGW